jgi:hypothetical protein
MEQNEKLENINNTMAEFANVIEMSCKAMAECFEAAVKYIFDNSDDSEEAEQYVNILLELYKKKVIEGFNVIF